MLNRVLAATLFLLYLFFLLEYRLKPIPEVWLFAAFVLWAALSGLVVARDEAAFDRMLLRVAMACGLAIAVAGIAQVKRSPTVNLMAVLTVAVGFAADSWTTGSLQAGLDSTSIRSTLPTNANTFGIAMLAGTFALAYFWGGARRRFLRPSLAVLGVTLAVALVSSASRKSFLALLVFLVLWMWFCYRRRFFRSITAFLAVVLLLVGVYAFATYAIDNSRLGVRLDNTGTDSGDQKRMLMYDSAYELFLAHPLTGVGLGNFNSQSGIGAYSHSDYAEVLSTTGLVGALLYFPIYVIWWRRLARVARKTPDPETRYRARLFQAILITMLLIGFGVPNFLQTEQWYWIGALIGYTFAMDQDLAPRLVSAHSSRELGRRHQPGQHYPTLPSPVAAVAVKPPNGSTR